MKQFVQLQEFLPQFEAAGVSIVGLTYDAPDIQQSFVNTNSIEYPFLSDVDAKSVQALQILNTQYQPGEGAYGIPYPGVYVVNPDMKIVGKIFVEAYSSRVDAAGVLAYTKQVLKL